jgi:hypothetical protein
VCGSATDTLATTREEASEHLPPTLPLFVPSRRLVFVTETLATTRIQKRSPDVTGRPQVVRSERHTSAG